MSGEKKHGCRSCFKNVFILIIGMLLGIVLFVGSIVGTVYVVLTSVTLEQMQNTIGVELIKEDNKEMLNMTVFEFVSSLIGMVGNISNTSINDLLSKFNLPIPDEIAGIDISPLFDYPILEIPQHVSDVTKNIKLSALEELAGVNFDDFNLPILSRLKNETFQTALSKLFNSINGNMTLRSLAYDFGIDLAGENELLNNLKDLSLSNLGDAVDLITLSEIISISNDLYIKASELDEKYLYVYADVYEAVDDLDVQGTSSTTSIFGVTADKSALERKELRYVRKTDENGNAVLNGEGQYVYEIDNSSYYFDRYTADDAGEFVLVDGNYVAYNESAHSGMQRYKQTESFEKYKLKDGKYVIDATLSGKTFYRRIEYKPFSSGDYSTYPERYLKAYINNFVKDGTDYVPAQYGYVKIYDYEYLIGTSTTANAPTSESEFTPIASLSEIKTLTESSTTLYVKYVAENGSISFFKLKSFGIDFGTELEPIVPNDDSSLSDEKTGYFKFFNGTSDRTLQSIATTVVKNLSDVVDKLKNLTLGEVIDVYDETVYDTNGITVIHEKSPAVLIALKNTKISDFSEKINTLTLKQIIDINEEDPNTSKILISLKDSTLNSLSTDIGNMVLSDAVEISDDSSSVLKKLAYTKINNVGSAISNIVDSLVLSEIVDVNEYNQLSVNDMASTYLLEIVNPYVEDNNGNYVFVNGDYVAYDSSDPSHAALQRYSQNYIFVKNSDGGYVYVDNSSSGDLVAYDVTNSKMPEFTEEYINDSSNTVKFYALDTNVATNPSFDIGDPSTAFVLIDSSNYATYKNAKYGKYVSNFVGFIKKPKTYDAATYGDLYKKVFVQKQLLTNVNEANTYVIANELLTVYDSDNLAHQKFAKYVPVPYEGDLAGYVYYSEDLITFTEYNKTVHGEIDSVKSNLYVMEIYNAETHSSYSGDYYIYYSGLLLDETGSKYPTLQHYSLVYGYLASADEVNSYVTETETYGSYTNVKTAKKVNYLIANGKEMKQSEKILIAINSQALSEMNSVFENLTLGDIINSEPDSFFDGEIMTSKINQMTSAITNKLSNAYMGDILNWANISVGPEISFALQNITLQDFFSGLKLSVDGEGNAIIVYEIS